MLNQLLFVALPYVALAIFLVGSIYRYLYKGFKVSSLSSQFLEGRQLFFGSQPFHWGLFFLFFVGIFLVGIAILFLKNGVEVDLVNHKYRDYKLLFGNYWGKWKPLAEGDYLLISKSTKRSAAPITMAMSATSSRVFYDLDLITKGSRDVILNSLVYY